jgi:hypothetical protein
MTFSSGVSGNPVNCDAGDIAVGGGVQPATPDNNDRVNASYPIATAPNPPTGWFTSISNLSATDDSYTWWAVCADVTP